MASVTADVRSMSMPIESSWVWSGPMSRSMAWGTLVVSPTMLVSDESTELAMATRPTRMSAVSPKNTSAAVRPRGRRGRRRTIQVTMGSSRNARIQARKNMDRMKKNGWTTMASSTATPSVTAMGIIISVQRTASRSWLEQLQGHAGTVAAPIATAGSAPDTLQCYPSADAKYSVQHEPTRTRRAATPMTGHDRAELTAELIASFERMRELTAQVHAPEFLSLDVTMQQAKALRIIQRTPGIRMSALAAGLGVGLSTVSGNVDRLAEMDLVVRHDDPADRRQVAVTLTERGREVMDRFQDLGARMMRDLLGVAQRSTRWSGCGSASAVWCVSWSSARRPTPRSRRPSPPDPPAPAVHASTDVRHARPLKGVP